jgi:hypothetical protein
MAISEKILILFRRPLNGEMVYMSAFMNQIPYISRYIMLFKILKSGI